VHDLWGEENDLRVVSSAELIDAFQPSPVAALVAEAT
jgi:hypothetical protein